MRRGGRPGAAGAAAPVISSGGGWEGGRAGGDAKTTRTDRARGIADLHPAAFAFVSEQSAARVRFFHQSSINRKMF